MIFVTLFIFDVLVPKGEKDLKFKCQFYPSLFILWFITMFLKSKTSLHNYCNKDI